MIYGIFVLALYTWNEPYYWLIVASVLAVAGHMYACHPERCSLVGTAPTGVIGGSRPSTRPSVANWLIIACESLVGLPVAADWLVQISAAGATNATAVRIADAYPGIDPTWYVGRTALVRLENVLWLLVAPAIAAAAVLLVRGWAQHRVSPAWRRPKYPAWLMASSVIAWLLTTKLSADALLDLLQCALPLALLADGLGRVLGGRSRPAGTQ